MNREQLQIIFSLLKEKGFTRRLFAVLRSLIFQEAIMCLLDFLFCRYDTENASQERLGFGF